MSNGGISPYSKVVALRDVNSSEISWCFFKLEFFFSKIFVRYFTIKVSTNWWNLFYNAKSSKYHSTEKQPLPWILSLYNLWGWFLPPFWSHRARRDSRAKRGWEWAGTQDMSLVHLFFPFNFFKHYEWRW